MFEFLDKNKDWLHILVGFVGASQIKATTDTPGARIGLTYTRRGVEHNSNFTLEELLSSITEDTVESQTHAPGDYTDIADLP